MLGELDFRHRLAVHLVGPVGEAQRARMRVGEGEVEILADAGAAADLDGAVDHLQRDVRRHDLDHRDLGPRRLVADLVHHARGVQA